MSIQSQLPSIQGVGRRVRFAEFVADFEQRELFRRGQRQPLQHKPFRILELLLMQPGALVTRQEIAHDLWPGSRVSFEKNLNTAMNALRLALGDSLQARRFIETRPGLGYRFIAPVSEVTELASAASADAGEDCLAARYFVNKMTSGDLHKAIAHYRAALRENPACAHASAGLAEAYSLLSLQAGLRGGDVCQEARMLALAAVESAPSLAEAHVALARARMIFDWDWKAARAACSRALELAPQLADAHRCYGLLHSICGEHEAACAAVARAYASDPFSLPSGTAMANSLFWARDFSGAERQCWKLLNLEPRLHAAQTILGMVYEQQGAISEAIIEFQNAYQCSDCGPIATAALAHALGIVGERRRAEELLEQLRNCCSGFLLAIAYCGLAEYDSALELLEQAVRERDPMLIGLPLDPRLDALRGYPTFDKLVQRIGLRVPQRASA